MKFSSTVIITGFLALTLSSALRAQDVDLKALMPKDETHRPTPNQNCANCHDKFHGQLSEAKLRASGATDEQIEAMKQKVTLKP